MISLPILGSYAPLLALSYVPFWPLASFKFCTIHVLMITFNYLTPFLITILIHVNRFKCPLSNVVPEYVWFKFCRVTHRCSFPSLFLFTINVFRIKKYIGYRIIHYVVSFLYPIRTLSVDNTLTSFYLSTGRPDTSFDSFTTILFFQYIYNGINFYFLFTLAGFGCTPSFDFPNFLSVFIT